MKIIDLFSGIGGFSLAGHWLGWETMCLVEWQKFPQQVLQRQFPGVPVYGDICEVDFTKYRQYADELILTGGFPCQPFSQAGKRKGTEDDRYLWPEMLRAIREARPRWVVGENVAGLITMDGGSVLEEVCADLENEGYRVESYVLPAISQGAPHRRDRIWIVAYQDSDKSNNGRQHAYRKQYRDVSVSDQTRDRGIFGRENKTYQPSINPGHSGAGTTSPNIYGKKEKERIRQQHGLAEPGESDQVRDSANAKKSGRDSSAFEALDGQAQKGRARCRPDHKDRRNPADGKGEGLCWDTHWLKVATSLCRVDDGLPAGLDDSDRRDIYKAVEQFGRTEVEATLGVDLAEVESRIHRANRLKALGNSIVPQVAYEIFKAINKIINYETKKPGTSAGPEALYKL